MRNLLIAATMAAVALAAPAEAQAAPGPVARDLGGLNLNAYCAHVYGSNFKSFLVSPQTANDWYCEPIIHHAGAVNHHLSKTPMTAACRFEYSGIGIYAKATRHDGGGAWQCFQPIGLFPHPL